MGTGEPMKRILVIEDQEDIREIVRVTLEMEGYETHEAENGPSGLKRAMELHPDLVLTDVMMPGGMDGYQVCGRIKSDPALRRIKVVILSAKDQEQDRRNGMRAGADDYLVKPFSPVELTRTVKRIIR